MDDRIGILRVAEQFHRAPGGLQARLRSAFAHAFEQGGQYGVTGVAEFVGVVVVRH